MDVAVYLRKSRADEQDESVEETLRKHKAILSEFAAANGLHIVRWYEEVVSGENLLKRSEMLKLLGDLDSGKYEAILCMDIDRLSRGTQKDRGIIFEAIRDNGLKIITPRKVYDFENDSDEMMYEIYGFVARQELKSITRRLKQGMITSMKNGCHVTDIPFGYVRVYEGKKNTLPTLAPHPENAEIVRMIFDMYTNQHIGTTTIADTINGMGIKPKRGSLWRRNTISWILKNPVYIGKIKWHNKTNDIYLDGKHPPLISKELFAATQAQIQRRTHPPTNFGQIANPLAGLVYCQNCGNKMTRQSYRKKYNQPRLLCATPGCMKSTRLDLVEDRVLDTLRQILHDYKYSAPSNADTRANTKKLLESLDKSITTARNQKSALQDLLEQRVYTIEDYQERSRVLDTRIKDLTAQKSKILQSAKKVKTNEQMRNDIKTVIDGYDAATPAQRNQMLKTVIDRIEYYKSPSARGNSFDITVILRVDV